MNEIELLEEKISNEIQDNLNSNNIVKNDINDNKMEDNIKPNDINRNNINDIIKNKINDSHSDSNDELKNIPSQTDKLNKLQKKLDIKKDEIKQK